MNVSFGNGIEKSIIKPKTTEAKEQKAPAKNITPRDSFGLPKGVTINSLSGYFPNIKGLDRDKIFDIQYESAVTLSDGSKLVRPICLSLGDVDIQPSEDNDGYTVTITPRKDHPNQEKRVRFMTEDELLSAPWAAKGKITKNPEGSKFPFQIEFEDKFGDIKRYNSTKKGCLNILEKNALYI